VGHKGEKFREIDLLNEARRPLHLYLQHGGRDESSPYVFTEKGEDEPPILSSGDEWPPAGVLAWAFFVW
jgi:hypothetical protein